MRHARWFAHPRAGYVAWAIVLMILASGVGGGVFRGIRNQPDWRAFSTETRFVWQHRTIPPWTGMFGYPPTAFFLLFPFTVWLSETSGVVAFAALNAAATALSLLVLYRYWFRPAFEGETNTSPPSQLFIWPIALMALHIQNVLQANQWTMILLLLCVGGLTLSMHGRDFASGCLIGLAASIKVTPIALIAFFALKQRWRAIGGVLVAVVMFDVFPAVAFFGTAGAIREHAAWLERIDWYSNARFIEDPWLRVTRHGHSGNWSLAVVLTRWLREPPPGNIQVTVAGKAPDAVVQSLRGGLAPFEHLTLDPMPSDERPWSIERSDVSQRANVHRLHIARLSGNGVRLIWGALIVAAFAAAMVMTWRRRRAQWAWPAAPAESACWLGLTLLPSPMLRDYYLPLLLPALVVLFAERMARSRTRGTHTAIFAWTAMVLCGAGNLLLVWGAAAWYGGHLATLLVLTLACGFLGRRTEPTQS